MISSPPHYVCGMSLNKSTLFLSFQAAPQQKNRGGFKTTPTS